MICLKGLNGANPLGFMAALGTLRLLSMNHPETRLAWQMHGAWRPVVTGFEAEEECLKAVVAAVNNSAALPDVTTPLEQNITVPPARYREFAKAAASDKYWSGFAAAFGCDALEDDKGRIQYTKLCFITGSGHQNFLETMRLLKQRTEESHLRRALFQDMEPINKGLSMRWDPADAKEYALQWANPGPEGVSASWGAYRLAIESLPFFPTAPESRRLVTAGFQSKDTFRWPIWSAPIPVDSIKALITMNLDRCPLRGIRARGIEEIFQSERVRIGEGANFKVSFRPATPASEV